MELILVRHFAPQIGAGICYGASDLDCDLAVHAEPLAALRRQLPETEVVFTSPLRRCLQLARALSAAPILDARLMEMDFGRWELQHWDAIERDEVDAWCADLAHYRPGGGESLLEMAERVRAFYNEVSIGTGTAVVICHAGTIRLLQAAARGLDPLAMALDAASRPNPIGYGEVVPLLHV